MDFKKYQEESQKTVLHKEWDFALPYFVLGLNGEAGEVAEKIKKVLRDNNSVPLRQVLKAAFDPKIQWALPKGEVPYTVNDAPLGTEHTVLSQQAKRLYLFIKGGDNTLKQNKRELLFVQMLEGLSADEAEFLVAVVNQKVNNKYKGFTANLVKEAFNWNDNFMKN